MAEEIDPVILKKTQEALAGVIKRPPLTDKNLKRPPFRFLHDVITNVIKSTGFLKGLYTADEMVSDNIKDKDAKMVFLQKAIDVLSLITNETINLKPSKVVAGHEAHRTNKFLQILGMAARSKLDSKGAVQAILEKSGDTTSTQKERRASVDKRSKNPAEKSRSTTKAVDPAKKSSTSNESSRNKDPEKKRSRSKDSKPKEGKEKSKDKTRSRRDDSKSRSDKSDAKKEKHSKRKEAEQPEEKKSERLPMEDEVMLNGHIEDEVPIENGVLGYGAESESQMVNGESLMDASLPIGSLNDMEIANGTLINEIISPKKELVTRAPSGHRSRPPSARSKRTKPAPEAISQKPQSSKLRPQEPVNRDSGSPFPRPPSARPSSSRPAPPRIRIRHIVENEEPRPPTAKPPAVENVILYQNQQSDEEEEVYFVPEEPPEDLKIPEVPPPAVQATPDEDKGTLVKQLLETQKDLETGSQQVKKTEIDKSQMSTAATLRARETTNKELEQLGTFIQNVSKAAFPLGKMLDYLQEDIDSMKAELMTWREEHKENLMALRREKNITETSLEPLRVQLEDLDQVVQDQLDANSALKATILRNDERIQRILAGLRRKS